MFSRNWNCFNEDFNIFHAHIKFMMKIDVSHNEKYFSNCNIIKTT